MSLLRVRVALPWLQAALAEASASDSVPALPALGWLARRGHMRTRGSAQWREWLLDPIANAPALTAVPAGPALAARHGQPIGAGSWCVAQPVHLAAGLDHLRLAPLHTGVPSVDEAAALGETVSAHFGGDPRVAGFFDGQWLLQFRDTIECWTEPPDAVAGHDVHDSMPAGRDGARVRSLMNEIQMLLHEHTVNLERERMHGHPINALWLWGFGTHAPATCSPTGWTLRSDDPWLNALWRQPATRSDAEFTDNTLIASIQPPLPEPAAALASVDAGLLSRLASQVRAGRIGRLDLLAGDVTLELDGLARWRIWRRPVPMARWLA
jgi:hypothetical protein